MNLLIRQIVGHGMIFNMNTSSDLMKWVFFFGIPLGVYRSKETIFFFFCTDMKGTLILNTMPK